MSTRTMRTAGAALAFGMTLTALAACGSDDSSSGGSTSGGSAAAGGGNEKIALLLPESKTARYEAFDRPYFEAAVKSGCAGCSVLYSNADQDANKQQQQAEAALTQGAKVLVISAVDGKAAASIVASAKAKNVPVIAYDRFIAGANYYVSFDNFQVGVLQGQTLVDIMKKNGKQGEIVMINGAPTDANAADFKKGAMSVLQSSGYPIAASYDTPDWSPDKAQQWMESQVTTVKDKLVGVYAANDGTAGGAIAALKGGGVNPLPPVTGQDAELAGIQRLLSGDQAMTVYKAIKPQAEDAAKNAIALAQGKKPASTVDKEGVPSTLLKPVAVTKDNIKDTVVKDGFWTVEQICTGEFAAACTEAGLS
ncbi:MAG TPA: sugar ABC transporter substrate-binding protein [Dermatophilaceae bacterium]|nr:sugar ABC transporter substrate-binding protein [Dermatophilaceae bacterium]